MLSVIQSFIMYCPASMCKTLCWVLGWHQKFPSPITADGDCSHEIKRRLLLGRKVMTNLDSILKSRDITLPTNICIVKAIVFPVVMNGCESWTIKKAEHWSGLLFPSPMHESEKSKWSCSIVSDSSRPHGLQPTRLLRPWDFPGKNTGVGCHRLLHKILL